MNGNDRNASLTAVRDARMTGFTATRAAADAAEDDGGDPVRSFDAFLDRIRAWPFHLAAIVTALAALWFGLAALGGLPRGPVELIALSMFGAFAYGVGFLVPLLFAFAIESSRRTSAVLALACGAALLWIMAHQGPL